MSAGQRRSSACLPQDEYQVNSRLTLSYGLRWQVLPGFQEDGGNLANFDQRDNSIVVPNALAGYLATQNITASNIAFQQSFNACNLKVTSLACTKYVTASQDGLPQSLRKTYKGNFQPRVAIAYRPFNDTKTVVRAGFGIFTMTNLGPLSFNNSGNPTSSLHSYSNANTAGANTPLIQFPNTAPPSTMGADRWRKSRPGCRSELPRSTVESVELDGGERDLQQHIDPRELCGDAHLQVEHHRGSEPDSCEHDALRLRDRSKSLCGRQGSVSELVLTGQHVQCG